jgi:hypothetical protein
MGKRMKLRTRVSADDLQAEYALAVHEAGHAAAAYSVGFGMTKRGIVLKGREGITYNRAPGFRSCNPKARDHYNRGDLIVSFAGPIAEGRVSSDLVHIDADVENIA